MISVKGDIREVTRYLTDLEKRQIPFAASNAINTMMFQSRKILIREMETKLDRPTKYTLGATMVEKATKKNWRARVWIKDKDSASIASVRRGNIPANFLLPHIRGGGRNVKGFEKQMIAAGIMPAGYYVTPGSAAKIDRFGNWSQGEIKQILAYFGAFNRYSGDLQNTTDKRKASMRAGGKRKVKGRVKYGVSYFVAWPNRDRTRHLFPGIYRKTYIASGVTALDMIARFVKRRPMYQAGRVDFFGVQERHVKKNFKREFAKELRRAISTAAARGKL
jgi:hypothetical protein